MNTLGRTAIFCAVAGVLSACSSMPKTTSLLDQTRIDYATSLNTPAVGRYAELELKQAGDAMEAANAAARQNDETERIDKLAYLAKQKIALANEAAKQRQAEAGVTAAAKERDQMRLDQRTNEADKANMNAEQARANTADAVLATAAAKNETAAAQARTDVALVRSAQLEQQLADLAAKKTERGIVITLSDVLFATDKAHLTPAGMRTLQKLAMVLQQNPERTVMVEGYADSTGSSAHNQALSERRASSVQTALVGMGVVSQRVSAHGWGEAYPVALNDTAQNRQLNRRVEIVLSDENGKISSR